MVLRAGCLCVSLPLSVTHAHTCTALTHAKGAGGKAAQPGGGSRVLQAATHGPVSVLEILWAAWDKHYYYNLHPSLIRAVQVPSSGPALAKNNPNGWKLGRVCTLEICRSNWDWACHSASTWVLMFLEINSAEGVCCSFSHGLLFDHFTYLQYLLGLWRYLDL